MKSFKSLINWGNRLMSQTPHSLLALFARIIVGLQFYRSGIAKFDGWFNISENTLFLFENEFTGVPLPFVLSAHMAGFSEVIFGLAVMFGLAARFGALALIGMTLVIEIFVYPEAYILHGLWAIALLYIVKYGAGFISIDHFIKRKFNT